MERLQIFRFLKLGPQQEDSPKKKFSQTVNRFPIHLSDIKGKTFNLLHSLSVVLKAPHFLIGQKKKKKRGSLLLGVKFEGSQSAKFPAKFSNRISFSIGDVLLLDVTQVHRNFREMTKVHEALILEADMVGLVINEKKTKCMFMGDGNRSPHTQIGEKQYESVEEFI
jgi:hypothetical protein